MFLDLLSEPIGDIRLCFILIKPDLKVLYLVDILLIEYLVLFEFFRFFDGN